MIKDITHLGVYAGSRAYGFLTPESDEDIRGVKWKNNLSSLIGLSSIVDHNSEPKIDTVYHTFRKFVFLLTSDSSFTQLDLLFTKPEDIIEIDQWGQLLINERDSFLAKNGIMNSCTGFAKFQYRFVTRNRPEARAGREGTVVLAEYGKQYRKAQHHSIRTLWQAIWCLKTGVWPVHVKDFDVDAHNMLMSIKTEALPYEEWEKLFAKYQQETIEAWEKSTLPETVDFNKWDKIVIDYNLWLIDLMRK